MSAPAEPVIDAISQASPDHRFALSPHPHRVQGFLAGVQVVDSRRALEMRETRLPEVLYFPRDEVRMDLLTPTAHRTYCPFKGNASYFSLDVDGHHVENAVWSYEEPLEGAEQIAGHLAFYANLLDRWLDDGEPRESDREQQPQVPGNPLLTWLLSEAPACANTRDLTDALIHTLLEAGIPLWRLNIIIPTLHPQMMALSYRWWRKSDELEEVRVPYTVQQEPQYLQSPLIPIFEGAGGIRRRLDITDPILDFPILRELHGEGATDYVAMPMLFSDGQINVVTLASTERGGFSPVDLGNLYEILPVLGRLYEVHAMRERATTLLDTYLGHHAGTRVLDGLIKRGDGESIEAVIWFCDLRESTPLAQSMPREDFLGLLNKFFDCMAGAVLEHDGQVLRFIGDAALAIFPISMAGSDDTMTAATARMRAIAAARLACERMRAINERRRERGRTELSYGIGLHQGEVTYGNIGTENRLEFTVIGDAANRAARIESMCKDLNCPVIVSEQIARHHPHEFRSLGHHSLRGVSEPLELFCFES